MAGALRKLITNFIKILASIICPTVIERRIAQEDDRRENNTSYH